jgi:hypothetical protein
MHSETLARDRGSLEIFRGPLRRLLLSAGFVARARTSAGPSLMERHVARHPKAPTWKILRVGRSAAVSQDDDGKVLHQLFRLVLARGKPTRKTPEGLSVNDE